MDWNHTAEVINLVVPFVLAVIVLIGGALGFRDPKMIFYKLDPEDVPKMKFFKKKEKEKDNEKIEERTE